MGVGASTLNRYSEMLNEIWEARLEMLKRKRLSYQSNSKVAHVI